MSRARYGRRLVVRCSALVAVSAVGCSQPPPPAREPAQPAVLIAPKPAPKPEAQPVAAQPKPEPPPEFKFTQDLTGQALAKSVAPRMPAKLSGEHFGNAPKPRAVPAKYLAPDPVAPAHHPLPPVRPAALPPLKPAAPAEKPPLTLGAGATELPAAVVLPVAPVVTERAKDVSVPPPAPLLGRQNTERVPFDDPTGEVGNVVIVSNTVPVQLGVSGFLKITVPDPFELAEQVKPNVPATSEPSAKPIEVNPNRVK